MDDRWYYRSNGQAEGPYNSVQIRQLAASGVITSETPLRQGEEGRWLRADHVQGMIGRAQVKTTSAIPAPAATSTVAVKPPAVRTKPAAPTPSSSAKPAPAKVRVVSTAPATAAVAVPASPAPSSVVDRRQQRHRQSPLPLLAAIIVVGILLLGGGAATIIAFVANPTDDNETQTVATSTVADVNSAAANVPSEDSESLEAATNSSVTSREVAVAAVKSWKPAIGKQGAKGGVKSSKMQVKFDGAWLGDDPNGDVGGPELVETTGQAKYLFVRLLVTNLQADQPLQYRGWNTAGDDTAAILVDDAGEFAELVPLADASTDRLNDVTIAPKANATDVLVFVIPDPAFEHLRLALPFPGVGHCGFQLERAMLAKPGQSANSEEIAQQPGDVEEDHDPVLGDPPAADGPSRSGGSGRSTCDYVRCASRRSGR